MLHQGYLLGAVMGIAGTVLSIAFADPMMHRSVRPLMSSAPGTTYLRIAAVPFILTSWLFIGNAALRGAGDTRSPMMVMFFVNIVNIVVAYSFHLRRRPAARDGCLRLSDGRG
jgi:multidrug resistance protein, MATE family